MDPFANIISISPATLYTVTKFGINIAIIIIKIAVVLGIGLLHVAYATYFERKVIGHMQVRLGPMRVGQHDVNRSKDNYSSRTGKYINDGTDENFIMTLKELGVTVNDCQGTCK